jgi:hypothetical protein
VEAFLNFPGIGFISELSDVFIQFRYSYGRARAAQIINITGIGLIALYRSRAGGPLRIQTCSQ